MMLKQKVVTACGALAIGGLLTGCLTSEIKAKETADGAREVTDRLFLSPLYSSGSDADSRWWSVPPLLTWESAERAIDGSWNDSVSLLLGLSYWTTRDDNLTSFKIFPLYAWWENGSWMTPLGGQLCYSGIKQTYFTPLFGVTSGARTGGWAFPLWSHGKDADFDEKLALIDSPVLPECVSVSVETNLAVKSSTYGQTRLVGTPFGRADSTAALLHDVDHIVGGCNFSLYGAPTNIYSIVEGYKRGNILLFNYAAERMVTYDLKTRNKLHDVEMSHADFILGLYRCKWARSRDSDAAFTSHRLLWRLFRYEYDPDEGTSIDFLFIPIWR